MSAPLWAFRTTAALIDTKTLAASAQAVAGLPTPARSRDQPRLDWLAAEWHELDWSRPEGGGVELSPQAPLRRRAMAIQQAATGTASLLLAGEGTRRSGSRIESEKSSMSSEGDLSEESHPVPFLAKTMKVSTLRVVPIGMFAYGPHAAQDPCTNSLPEVPTVELQVDTRHRKPRLHPLGFLCRR